MTVKEDQQATAASTRLSLSSELYVLQTTKSSGVPAARTWLTRAENQQNDAKHNSQKHCLC